MERLIVLPQGVRQALTTRASDVDGWASIAIITVAIVLFAPLEIIGDGQAYLQFVERLFGDTHHAVGWVFGLAIMNAPFYAIGKLLATLGVTSIAGHPTREALVSLGGNVYMLLAVAIVARMLGDLRLPSRTFVALAATIGTPLLYYGLFLPSGTHAAETFLVSAAIGLLLIAFRRPQYQLQLSAAVGATLGLAAATRYSLATMIAGLLVIEIAYRRWAVAAVVAASSALTWGLAALAPLLTGSEIFAKNGVAFELGWAPLTPFRMLFTDDRGLFVWTPVMLIGIIGFAHAIARRHNERLFYVQVGAMQLAYLCFHFLVPEWWQGGSFSSRFFTSMFPMVAIGLGEALTQKRRLTYVLASLAAVWSLYLCINVAAGIDVVRGDQRPPHLTSATDVAVFPVNKATTLKVYLYSIWHMSHLSGK